MKEHYKRILHDSDARVRRSMEIQISEKDSDWYGGFVRPGTGCPSPKYAIYRVTTMIACLLNEESRYYQDPAVYESVLKGLRYITASQRQDGFFDLGTLNFCSAPDTAFCIKRMLPVYEYLLSRREKDGEVTDLGLLREQFGRIIQKGADAILTGGFHTPNHRWAITAALLSCGRLFDRPAYREFAERFLAEGVDNTPDGEYAERSAGNYNRVNNDAMITIAQETGDSKYYDYAAKNLYMMLSYMEPDGTIFTNNSTRQDYGKKVFPKNYYMEYLFMGWKFKNPDFLKAANSIMETVERNQLSSSDCLIQLMNQPELIQLEFEESGMPASYQRYFADSHIVRGRNQAYSWTILGNSSHFLYFRHGEVTMSVKLAVPFFENRYFVPTELKKTEDGYELTQTMAGWYYLPFGEYRGTSDWWEMDNAHTREKIYGPNLRLKAAIRETEDGLRVTLETEGVDRVPLTLEFAFGVPVRIENPYMAADGAEGKNILLKEGFFQASADQKAIRVGPAFAAHSIVPESEDVTKVFRVLCTDFSNCSHEILISAVPG